MAVDKLIDSTIENACRTAEADAIRAKTGGTAQLTYDFDNGKGFADAIAGISGGKPEQSKTLTLGAAAPSTVTPDSGKVLSSVPVTLDASVIKAENIAKDVTMLGIIGTHEGGGGGGGVVELSTDEEMQAVLTAENVGKAYRFVGTTGTYTYTDVYAVVDRDGSYSFKHYVSPMTDYLCFTALDSGCSVDIMGSGTMPFYPSMEYSRDGTYWSSFTRILLENPGDKVYLRGNNTYFATSSGTYWYFEMNGRISASGNIMSLLNYTQELSEISSPYAFFGLFKNCTSLVTAPKLPATRLSEYCYYSMFDGCTGLTATPELPATTVAANAYKRMFHNCTSLVSANRIMATTLNEGGCYGMFYECTSLVTAPELPAVSFAGKQQYYQMFRGCTSLTTPPELPATTLAQACYQEMFYGCTSLVTAPELPATTLAQNCYRSMFRGCTSLTTPPELPATTLAQTCYQEMFYGCTSLTTLPALPATTITGGNYNNMFRNCTGIRLSETQDETYTKPYRIPTSGEGSGTGMTSMFTGTGGTFTGTPVINTTYYLAE